MGEQTLAATKVVGTHVENWDGENLGVITDIMINKYHGEVAYLVLSYPGEYGQRFPDKRFAVPFESIARQKKPDGTCEYIINVEPEFLQQAPGFESNDSPDFADERFTSVIKDFYKDVSVDIRV